MYFKKVIDRVDALKNGAMFVPYKTNGNTHKIHPSPPSVLSAIKQDLSRFVFEMRQHRIQVSTRMIHQEACHLLPNFRGMSIIAKNLGSYASPRVWGYQTMKLPTLHKSTSKRTNYRRGGITMMLVIKLLFYFMSSLVDVRLLLCKKMARGAYSTYVEGYVW